MRAPRVNSCCACRAIANLQIKRSPKKKLTQITTDVGNDSYGYVRIPCISVSCSHVSCTEHVSDFQRKFQGFDWVIFLLSNNNPVCPNLFMIIRTVVFLLWIVTSWNLCWNLLLTFHMKMLYEHQFQNLNLKCHFDWRRSAIDWIFNTSRAWG
jgi:hypothetical protein